MKTGSRVKKSGAAKREWGKRAVGRGALGVLLVAGLTVFGFTACGSTEETKSSQGTNDIQNDKPAQDTADVQQPERAEGENYFGQIKEINGNTITLALAEEFMEKPDTEALTGEKPENPSGAEAPSGEKSGNQPDAEAPSGEKPENPSGAEAPSGEKPENQQALNLTGETMELQVPDAAAITVNGEEALLENLLEGDVIRVQLKDGVVVSIHSGVGK